MIFTTGTPEQAGMSPQRVRHLKELARSWVEEGVHPALVVLVARRGVIVLHEAFGRLTPEQDSPPLARDALFPLSSISKPILATAAMTLVEDGILSLNRPVSDYVPEFRGEGKDAVMVHHLLTHTSGLRNEDLEVHAKMKRNGGVEIPPPDGNQHPWTNELLFLHVDSPLWKAPGEEMSYCSFNYELLGEIVRRLSGESLVKFVGDRVLQPLGMTDTHYVVPNPFKHRVVRRPVDAPLGPLSNEILMDTPVASAGVYSTAIDMATFGQMFLNGGRYGEARILSRASVTEMTRNQIPGIPGGLNESRPEASWGYGWGVQGEGKWEHYSGSLESRESFEHSGAGGVRLWVDPVYRVVGVYFSVILNPVNDGTLARNTDLFKNAVTAAVDD